MRLIKYLAAKNAKNKQIAQWAVKPTQYVMT